MANQSVSVFQFQQSFDVRVQVINGEPWFCLRDVCVVLDIPRTSDLVQVEKDVVNNDTLKTRGGLDAKGVAKNHILTNGGNQQITFINEPNLYRVIFRSNKPEAKHFQDWVFNEVLPTIRKTGSYTIAKAAIETITPTQYHNLRVMVNDIADSFHFKGSWEHWAWRHIRALSNGEVAAKLPATMYDQAVTVLKALEVDASLFLSQQRDREKEFLRQDRALLTQRVQMALPLQ